MAFIKIKSGNQTHFYQGATAQSAFNAFTAKTGRGGSFTSISQQAFASGLAGFGFSTTGQPLAKKAVPKPVAKKVVPKKVGPSAESIAAKAAEKKILDQQAGLKKEGAAIQTGFEEFVSGQEAVPDLRARLKEELGIPELAAQLEPLRQQSLKLGGDLLRLPEDIEARTRGSLITESQTRLLEQKAGEKLGAQIRDISLAQELFAGQLTGAQAELVSELSSHAQQYTRDILPWQTKITAFQERAARESSAFSTAVQDSLNAQLQGIQRMSDIAENDLQRIHDFALLEQQFLNDLQKISAQGAQTRANQSANQASGTSGQVPSAINNELQAVVDLAARKGVSPTGGLKRVADSLAKRFPAYAKQIAAFATEFGGGVSGGGGGSSPF